MIELSKINKVYCSEAGIKTQALSEIDMTIDEGEFVVICGKSGSGKTTLMNIVGCMDWADSGIYRFGGQDVSALKFSQLADFRNRKIGFVFQAFNLIRDMTVYENIELPLGYSGMKKADRRKEILAMIEKMELTEKLRSYPSELSGGQQQRIAIARALINRPALVLADEPTGNLDSKTAEQIMMLFQEIHRSGTTIMMITHDAKIAQYGTRVIEIADGRI